MGSSDINSKNSVIAGWVNAYTDDMLSWAYYKTSDMAVAEDIVQEAFLSAHKSFERFENKSSPKTWLFSILRNKIYDHHRSRFRNKEFSESRLSDGDDSTFLEQFFNSDDEWHQNSRPGQWEEDTELLDDHDFREIMQYCMERLPARWFSCIHLKYLKEMEGKDICQELEITPSNFWQILHRAKLQLRECLEIKWFRS